ncbi:MAG: mercuric transport protein MerTP, partial [Blastocatellia bacterium]|nr:mercuric transport protein MerTP [Blastocatellia bacterium]
MSFIKSYLGVGVFAATASALCCITPVIAMLGGISGIAATFSWVEPFRPYLIGVTVLALGFAWFQKLKPQAEIDCACDHDKPRFFQGKTFLGLTTVVAILMLTFPSYSSIFFRATPKTAELPTAEQTDDQVIAPTENKDEFENVVFVVGGMTCAGCEQHIK